MQPHRPVIAARVRAALHRGDTGSGGVAWAAGDRGARTRRPSSRLSPMTVSTPKGANRGARTRRPSSRHHVHRCLRSLRPIAARVRAALHRGLPGRPPVPHPGRRIAARVRAALHRGSACRVRAVPRRCNRGARTRRPSSRLRPLGHHRRGAVIAARVRAALHRGTCGTCAGKPPAGSRRAYAPPFIEAGQGRRAQPAAAESRRAYAPPFIEAR